MKKSASGYRLIFGYLGLFIVFIGLGLLLPLLLGIVYPEELSNWPCFVIPSACSIVVGIILFSLIIGRDKAQLEKHQDSILLVMIWVTAVLISAVPFILKGNLSFTDAVFESASGYATVGLSTFTEADYASKIFVLYRSLLCFFGGVGLVLVITSAISDRYGLKLYLAEGHNDKLMPNLAKSARLILSIFAGLIVLGTGLLVLAGVPWFDSLIFSISALATAGFGSTSQGVVALSSLPNYHIIQLILCVLMILGAINFLIHLFLITGKFKKAFRDAELKFFLILSLIMIPLFFISTFQHRGWHNAGQSFSEAVFTYISAITTTGFSNVSNFSGLGEGVMLLVVLCTIIGGGMGSTAGGVKMYRVVITAKSFYWTTKKRLNSSSLIYPHFVWRFGEEKEVTSIEAIDAFGYMVLYLLVLFFGGLLIVWFNGSTFNDSIFEFANAISSTGLSNGLTSTANIATKWVLILGMIAGRLEFLCIYFAVYKIMRDIFRKEKNYYVD